MFQRPAPGARRRQAVRAADPSRAARRARIAPGIPGATNGAHNGGNGARSGGIGGNGGLGGAHGGNRGPRAYGSFVARCGEEQRTGLCQDQDAGNEDAGVADVSEVYEDDEDGGYRDDDGASQFLESQVVGWG